MRHDYIGLFCFAYPKPTCIDLKGTKRLMHSCNGCGFIFLMLEGYALWAVKRRS
jgi:hypothetical protein